MALIPMVGRIWRYRSSILRLCVIASSPAVVAGTGQTKENDSACKSLPEQASMLLTETSADQTISHHNVDPVQSIRLAPPTATKPNLEKLPILTLPRGWSLDQAVSMPGWLTVSASALSQNNGAITGGKNRQFTSSNLFNVGFKLLPLVALRSVAMATSEPRQGDEIGEYPNYNIAINGLFTQRAGQVLSSSIPNELNTQWNFGNGPVARLGFLNVEYKREGDFVSMLKLGKLMQAEDFSMNPIQCYFSNFGFCGWAQGVPAMIDIPGNPFNSYGAVIAFGNSRAINFRYGIYQIAPASFAPDLHGFDFSFNKGIGTAHFAEVRFPISIETRIPINYDKEKKVVTISSWQDADTIFQSLLPPGTITLGGWLGSGSFQTVIDPKLKSNYNNGAYGIMSFRIPGLTLGLNHRAFVSTGIGLSQKVQEFRSAGNAGIVIEGLLPKRLFDTFSIGASYASYNPHNYLPGLVPGAFTPGTEWIAELNYSLNINQNMRIMPNLQVIINPAGDSKSSAVVVAGLQIWLFF